VSGNTIGQLFRVTTWGESHGPSIGVVIDGCPPGIPLTDADITEALARRRPRGLVSETARSEPDHAAIVSGVFEGLTTGTPISITILNADARSADYDRLRTVHRPGHGDLTYDQKYGRRDYRGGGRASARETATRVAAGEVARRVLLAVGVETLAYTLSIGGVAAQPSAAAPLAALVTRDSIEASSVRCPDPAATARMLAVLEEVALSADSVGGSVEIVVRGCPPGLGEPVFEKLDAALAGALMSIGAVKSVEVGAGCAVSAMRGSEANDPIGSAESRNNAGGILAGISSGDDIVLRVAVKPIPTIGVQGRHDACAIPRINPVCEAMVNIVLADHLLRQRAIEGWVR